MILNLIEKGNSSYIADEIVKLIIHDESLLAELMHLFFSKKVSHHQRASWPVSRLAENYPQLIQKYTEQMIDYLDAPVHNAVTRCILRSLQFLVIPEKKESELYDKSLNFVTRTNVPAAIRVFAMSVAVRIGKKYPDLVPELKSIIQECYPYATPGFRSRAKRILEQL